MIGGTVFLLTLRCFIALTYFLEAREVSVLG